MSLARGRGLWFTFIGGLLALMSGLAWSAPGPEAVFATGRSHYESAELEAAIESFEAAVRYAPEVAEYHYWLGKAYGRLAERSSWIRAIELAQKTRHCLEKAVELEPGNKAALTDLMRYYRQAPAFLGGSNEKADAIEQQLREAQETPDAGDGFADAGGRYGAP